MKLTLVRKKEEILFAEAGKDFVDALTKSVKSSPRRNEDDALAEDECSIMVEPQYPPHPLESVPPPDVASFTHLLTSRPCRNPGNIEPVMGNMTIDGHPGGGPCILSSNAHINGTWRSGVAFVSEEWKASPWEITVIYAGPEVSFMVGFAPMSEATSTRLEGDSLYKNWGYYVFPNAGNWRLCSSRGDWGSTLFALEGTPLGPGDRISLRFTPGDTPKCEVAVRDGDWKLIAFAQPIPNDVDHCPTILICSPSTSVEVVSCGPPIPPPAHHLGRYLISSELNVTESTAVGVIQIARAKEVDMRDVIDESTTVTTLHLGRLREGWISSRQDILSYAFFEKSSSPSAGSSTRSDSCERSSSKVEKKTSSSPTSKLTKKKRDDSWMTSKQTHSTKMYAGGEGASFCHQKRARFDYQIRPSVSKSLAKPPVKAVSEAPGKTDVLQAPKGSKKREPSPVVKKTQTPMKQTATRGKGSKPLTPKELKKKNEISSVMKKTFMKQPGTPRRGSAPLAPKEGKKNETSSEGEIIVEEQSGGQHKPESDGAGVQQASISVAKEEKKAAPAKPVEKSKSIIAHRQTEMDEVFNGAKAITKSGLTKKDLVKNKRGKVVTIKQSEAGKRHFQSSGMMGFRTAVDDARKELKIVGWCPVGGPSARGTALLKKARSLYKKRTSFGQREEKK